MSISKLLLAPLQPLLLRIVRNVASANPGILDRLGPHQQTRFIIDPIDLPFALFLRPDPANLRLEACTRSGLPSHDARIAGTFFQLVRMIDGEEDGDAMFFARDLTITGNTEAIVSLRNALDNLEGSLADQVADLFGRPGNLALSAIRNFGGWAPKGKELPS